MLRPFPQYVLRIPPALVEPSQAVLQAQERRSV